MKEEIQMLREATIEIKVLRRQNELMKSRLDMFDSINAMLHTEVARKSESMSPDLVHQIEKYIENIEKQSNGGITEAILPN